VNSAVFHEATADMGEAFASRGYKLRHFFPHRIHHFAKCGPDAFRIAASMCGVRDPAAHRELVLYAPDALIEDLPGEVFFDDDLIWHQQQFGRPGQVATANLVLDGRTLRATTLLSDLVQRISRRRDLKTRVEARFKGWVHMLLNGVLDFALSRDIDSVAVPRASLVLRHTARDRHVGPELYRRIYDETVHTLLRPRRDGDWWLIDVDPARVVRLRTGREALPAGRMICVCHDVERGFGHLDVDPRFAASADETSRRSLESMLAIEGDMQVRATYNVLGLLLPEVRRQIEPGGHALAFHSYDHRVDGRRRLREVLHGAVSRVRGTPFGDPRGAPQLSRCREVDYRIKGYRPPRSHVGSELSDANLLFHNVEWLASSQHSLARRQPGLIGGIVKIPIAIDDFDLHRGRLPYDRWEDRVVELLEAGDFGAVCLHDCYAPRWLSRYRGLLERIQSLGRVVTVDELAAEVTLASGE
jgi:peptidoglycan/xylan/chitin deacetylase (PgdA/CDA1 family)